MNNSQPDEPHVLVREIVINPLKIEGQWYIETEEGWEGSAERERMRYGPIDIDLVLPLVNDLRTQFHRHLEYIQRYTNGMILSTVNSPIDPKYLGVSVVDAVLPVMQRYDELMNRMAAKPLSELRKLRVNGI